MTTNKDNNLFVRNGQLYIVPTLTSDEIGRDAIFDGYTYTLDGCTTNNRTACVARSNARVNAVVQPVQSARITTQSSASISFGKVEVRAKLPQGDWLWPAIWMLPVDSAYGPWPMSGEIDVRACPSSFVD
jgi:beta-glucanase (GH16 family)